ncbi:hypothetical protein L596_019646 [Steinernema carpocapsae]|uniref:Uncharacterized protein n=1 Tax=Steinernema carpocapsae TaxID=34508 RepID=A0A4U5MR92_STECR|nr:hypothetical protein L596_019646 [Steinernema carpocapsae]
MPPPSVPCHCSSNAPSTSMAQEPIQSVSVKKEARETPTASATPQHRMLTRRSVATEPHNNEKSATPSSSISRQQNPPAPRHNNTAHQDQQAVSIARDQGAMNSLVLAEAMRQQRRETPLIQSAYHSPHNFVATSAAPYGQQFVPVVPPPHQTAQQQDSSAVNAATLEYVMRAVSQAREMTPSLAFPVQNSASAQYGYPDLSSRAPSLQPHDHNQATVTTAERRRSGRLHPAVSAANDESSSMTEPPAPSQIPTINSVYVPPQQNLSSSLLLSQSWEAQRQRQLREMSETPSMSGLFLPTVLADSLPQVAPPTPSLPFMSTDATQFLSQELQLLQQQNLLQQLAASWINSASSSNPVGSMFPQASPATVTGAGQIVANASQAPVPSQGSHYGNLAGQTSSAGPRRSNPSARISYALQTPYARPQPHDEMRMMYNKAASGAPNEDPRAMSCRSVMPDQQQPQPQRSFSAQGNRPGQIQGGIPYEFLMQNWPGSLASSRAASVAPGQQSREPSVFHSRAGFLTPNQVLRESSASREMLQQPRRSRQESQQGTSKTGTTTLTKTQVARILAMPRVSYANFMTPVQSKNIFKQPVSTVPPLLRPVASEFQPLLMCYAWKS